MSVCNGCATLHNVVEKALFKVCFVERLILNENDKRIC